MNRTRTRQVIIRLSDEEYQQLQELVKNSGLKQQEYLLKSALNTEIHDYKKVIPELKRIGNNVNQVARKCNEVGSASGEDAKQLQGELKKIWQLLKP